MKDIVLFKIYERNTVIRELCVYVISVSVKLFELVNNKNAGIFRDNNLRKVTVCSKILNAFNKGNYYSLANNYKICPAFARIRQ